MLRETMRNIATLLLMALALVGTVASRASAVSFSPGDVFVAVNDTVQRYNSSLDLVDTLYPNAGLIVHMAFDGSGNLYVSSFRGGQIVKFDNTGTLVGTFASGIDAFPMGLVFDMAGNLYVAVASGDRDVRKYSSTGTLLAQYDVAIEYWGATWVDLAADQKTLFYTSQGRKIRRYDVTTGTQLSDFATLPGSGYAEALRLLPGGGLLVADHGDIKRLDSSGNVIQTYDLEGHEYWYGLSLDPDGTSFWSGSQDKSWLYKFDIAKGTVLASIYTGGPQHGLAVYGPTGGGHPVIPEPASVTLAGIGLMATIPALRRRRR